MTDVLVVNVSKDGPTTSIQEAIRLVKNYIEESTSITGDIRINIGEGVYAGFTIPDGTTSPLLGSVHKLRISSGGSYFPILDFNNSSESFPIGIDLGSNNPNIEISNLRIQYFAVGIRALANCHELVVYNCIVSNNRNSGIFLEHCEEVQLLQNIVVNGDYGIVSRLCKNSSIVHNTIFLNGAISSNTGTSVSAVWCEAGHDYGSGITDTGKIYLIGNIITNTAGTAMTLFYEDVESNAVVSNFNLITHKNSANYIKLEDRTFYGSRSVVRRAYITLTEWKTTGQDLNSISSSPGFVKALRDSAGRTVDYIDLSLISTSPAIGLVPSFYVNATETATWLPTYVDSSYFSKDILGNPRETQGTSAGCNDRSSNSGFYGQDIFTNPLSLSTKDCDKNPIEDIIFSKIQRWFPKLKKGYFFSADREYYLYAKKECKYIGELAVTEFIAPGTIALNKPIILYVAGTKIEDPSYLDIVGDKIILYHKDLNINSLEEELHIECSVRTWGQNNGFSYDVVNYRFKIKDGKTIFLLPKSYVSNSPIVLTDDKAGANDPDQSANREFSTKLNNLFGCAELLFNNNNNKVINGQFDYGYGSEPMAWASSGATVSYLTGYTQPCYGDFVCSFSSGFIEQLIPTDSNPECISFHHLGSGSVHYTIEYIDHAFNKMGYVITGSAVNNSSLWTRSYLALGCTGDSKTGDIPENTFRLNNLGYYNIPDDPSYYYLKFHTTGNLTYLDGVQAEKGTKPSLYNRRYYMDELTVEYETSREEYFIDRNLSISPLRTHFSDGFLYIPEICATNYLDGPQDPSVTTLYEHRWPEGRRTILPWARTLGKDKLRYRPAEKFHNIPSSKNQTVARALNINNPKDIVLLPKKPVCLQGDLLGTGFSIVVTDEQGNPAAGVRYLAHIYSTDGRYPGTLFKSLVGLKEQLNQKITSTLDNFGSTSLVWIPPSFSSGIFIGNTPLPVYKPEDGRYYSYISTRYETTLETIGSLSIRKEDGNFLKLYGNSDRNFYTPVYKNDNSYVVLPYMVKKGTVTVWVDGVQLIETPSSFIDSSQFYLDYSESKVHFKGRRTSVEIEYTPLYYYTNSNEPYKLIFDHEKVFGDYTGKIIVGCDYKINLEVQIEIPGYSAYISKEFELIAKNSESSNSRLYNPISLEI